MSEKKSKSKRKSPASDELCLQTARELFWELCSKRESGPSNIKSVVHVIREKGFSITGKRLKSILDSSQLSQYERNLFQKCEKFCSVVLLTGDEWDRLSRTVLFHNSILKDSKKEAERRGLKGAVAESWALISGLSILRRIVATNAHQVQGLAKRYHWWL